MGRINAEWHKAHPMPKTPTMDQRIAWHIEHAKHCGCRRTSAKQRDAFRKRAAELPPEDAAKLLAEIERL